MSRATDVKGGVQPTRESLIAAKGSNAYYHYNAICAWGIERSGAVTHVYG
jgi:sulfane dehydrogenase subunit SoxC